MGIGRSTMTGASLLGLIVARSGSVRSPNKNGRPFASRSLLEIAVGEALAAKHLDAVGLSTDSDTYREVARNTGLKETYLRPDHLSGPETSSADCVLHYVEWIKSRRSPEITHVVLLQPTSPFRSARDIDQAIEAWRKSGRASLVSMTPMATDPRHIVLADGMDKASSLERWEDTRKCFVLDGALFITSMRALKKSGKFWDQESLPFINTYPCIFDIDTDRDFEASAAVYLQQGSKR